MLLGMLGSGSCGDVSSMASGQGVRVDELLRWAGREKTADLARRLDRFQCLLTRLLVTTACLRAASRLAHRGEGDGGGDEGGGGVVVADKLDLDIVKALLPRLGEVGFGEEGSAGGGARDEVAAGGIEVPTGVEFDAVRAALEALGDAGGDEGGAGGFVEALL